MLRMRLINGPTKGPLLFYYGRVNVAYITFSSPRSGTHTHTQINTQSTFTCELCRLIVEQGERCKQMADYAFEFQTGKFPKI